MDQAVTKVPVKSEGKGNPPPTAFGDWRPFDTLRREVDRLFDGFTRPRRIGLSDRFPFDIEPFWRRDTSWVMAPVVDIVDKDKAYEITAELPGMAPADIDLKIAHGVLTITGEKKEETEEKKKDYCLSERRYGSFQRSFQVPDGVDADKVGASFEKGVLTVTLPKSAEARNQEKKIAITAK